MTPRESLAASVKTMSLGEIQEVSESGAIELDSRAELMEKLLESGVGAGGHLDEAYQRIAENPAKVKGEDVKARAVLYAKILKSESPTEKADLVNTLLDKCDKAGIAKACYRLLGDKLGDIPASDDKARNSKIAKVLIFNGK